MDVIPNAGAETAPPRKHFRVLKRVAGAGLIILGLAFLSLLWPGWPLHPLASLASWRAQTQGIELHIRSPWLHLKTDRTLCMKAADIHLGDRNNPAALALKNLTVRWQLIDLAHARWAPESVRLTEATCTRVAAAGRGLRFVEFPSAPPTALASVFTPADLRSNVLPQAGHAINLTIARTQLILPANLPVSKVTTGPIALTLGQPHAGHLNLAGSLDLKVDDRPGSVQFEGQLALTHDWLGQFKSDLNAAPNGTTTATRITLVASRTDATQPATISLRINDCVPGEWLALLGRTDLPKITGRFDAEFEAHGDPIRRHLDVASARIDIGAFTITQPLLLTRPLTLTPFQLALNIEDNGNRGTLAPFATQTGPLTVSCSGITWESKGTTVSGNGRLQMGSVPLTALLEWLPTTLRAKLPLTVAEASEIGLATTTVTLDATGERTAAPPHLHVSTRTGLTLNQELVAIEAESRFDPATRQIDLQVVLPDFVQARWQLALLRRFPVPELSAPLRAEFNLSGHWPSTLDDACWRIVAGQGYVIPKGPSLRWLARPFPITSLALSGRLNNDQKKLAIEQLDLVSGRAHLAFERTELQSPQALTTMSGPASANARFALKLEHWYAADFIPLLGPELQAMIAPAAADLAQIGLEILETSAELNFARLPWIDPTLTTLNGTQTAIFRIGEERLPVDTIWKFESASRRIATTLHLEGLRPDHIKLPSLKNLPLSPDALDLAFSVNLEVSANPYAKSIDLMDLKADLRLQADDGRIKVNPFLPADLPVKHLAMAASARILPLRLDHLKAEVDFDGPTLLIDDANLDFGETGRGELRMSLRELPLDWALARVPATWKPALLKDTKVSGRLAKFDLSAEFPSPTKTTTLPLPTTLTIAVDLRDLILRIADRPELTLPHLDLSGDAEHFDLRIDHASTDGLGLINCTATITTPLTPARQAKATGTVEADLARLPALLTAAKPWVTLPPSVNLTGLAGQATLKFSAASPLDPAKIPTGLRATAEVTARQVMLPMLPANVRIGPSAFTLTANVTGQNTAGSFAWQPSTIAVAPWITGAPTLNAIFATTPQAIELHPQIDLAATVIDLPQLCWHKSVGLPAKILADARLTLRTPTTPGHLNATIETEGLIIAPLRTRAEADLSDERYPPINLLPGVAHLQLHDTKIGLSAIDLNATRDPDGATLLQLRSPLIDLAAWISQFSSAITAWNKAQVPLPAAVIVATKLTPAPSTPPTTTAIPILNLPAITLQADITRVSLTPTSQLTNVMLAAALREGLPASLKFTASAGEKTSIAMQLDSAVGRQPWQCSLIDLGGWLRTAASPLSLLSDSPPPPNSPLETLRTLPATFVSGDITLQGTADWRDLTNTVDGSFHIDHLELNREIKFLSRIAALVKKRVILHVPFKVFDVPAFTASPTLVSLKKMRVEGPLTLTSEHLNLDLTSKEIDMRGKILGINFDVAGPISDPSFYLTEKNLLIKVLASPQEDFNF